MARILTVEVTQEDINHGARGSCQSCPIALAIQRLLEEPYFPSVNRIHCWIFNPGIPDDLDCSSGNYFELPPEAVSFISGFDTEPKSLRDLFKPFTFSKSISNALARRFKGELPINPLDPNS